MMVKKEADNPLRVISALVLLAGVIVIAKLFVLQIVERKYYSALASNRNEIYKQLYPRRGNIFFQDARSSDKEYPAAVNRQYYLLYATPRDILPEQVNSTTDFLANILNFSSEEKSALAAKLSKVNDPYEPIAKKVSEEIKNQIQLANLPGINTVGQEFRYYPEGNLAANALGFIGSDAEGNMVGRYGVEGFWDKNLMGKSGFLAGERGALGSIITLADRTLKQAEDGADLLLTIDRNLQYKACERLRQGLEEYQAQSAALIILDPKTGAILAMCSLPDFDLNNYSEVKDLATYNNASIFIPYETGSVFKPIVMSMALDLGLVSPFTLFTDPGERIINGYKIHNALNKTYGTVTMTGVLENSINTGMIWVAEKIGRARFKEYAEKFGFGKKTGIDLDTEAEGDVVSLDKKAEIYTANGSFGQGFTATPIQLAVAYGALANGGKMLKPYIVEEIRYKNGQVEKTKAKITDTALSAASSKLITSMLISVVENGHGKKARLDDYYVAAKTGTAQVAKGGQYSESETNHTFVGYFPAMDPKFVLLVKYEAPQKNWAESTAAPVFKDVAKFALDYYGIPGDKN